MLKHMPWENAFPAASRRRQGAVPHHDSPPHAHRAIMGQGEEQRLQRWQRPQRLMVILIASMII